MNAYGPLQPAQSVADFETTLVVAPPAYDIALGCGGTIALLRQQKRPVSVLVPVTKTLSSSSATANIASLRSRHIYQTETLTALDRLGVTPASVRFLELPGERAPAAGEAGFAETLQRCMDYLAWANPDTVLLPWRQDVLASQQCRATRQLITAAAGQLALDCRWLEYSACAGDDERPDTVVLTNTRFWRLDISPVFAAKRSAISACQSSPPPWELFLEDSATQTTSVAR